MLRLVASLFKGISLVDKIKNGATLLALALFAMGIGKFILHSIETAAQNRLLLEQKAAQLEEYNRLLTSASASLAQYFDTRARISREGDASKKMVVDAYTKDKANKDWGDTFVPSDFVRLL